MAKKAKNVRTFFLNGKLHKDITQAKYLELTGAKKPAVKEEKKD